MKSGLLIFVLMLSGCGDLAPSAVKVSEFPNGDVCYGYKYAINGIVEPKSISCVKE